MLPGEPTTCQASGIVACARFHFKDSFPDEFEYYRCFDSAGNIAWQDLPEGPPLPAGQLPPGFPCSLAQLEQFVAAYANPCWKKIPASAMFASIVTSSLDLAKMPTQVCSSVDGMRYEWDEGCTHLVYDYGCWREASASTAPLYCDVFFSSMQWYSWWNLTITPPTTAPLSSQHPFLACCTAYAHAYNSHISLATGSSLVLEVYNGKYGLFTEAEFPTVLDQKFSQCSETIDLD